MRPVGGRQLRAFGSSSPVVELREYQLAPSGASAYLAATQRAAPVRHRHVPTRLCSLPETGGQLNRFSHWYGWTGGQPERAAARAAMAADSQWGDYLAEVRPCVTEQSSLLFAEAPLVAEFGLHGFLDVASPGEAAADPVYEYRRYQLRLGYDTVPLFLKAYRAGLPSKLANQHSSTSLCSVLYTEVGHLNEVIEIWRHGEGVAAMEASRVAARSASEWRSAIAEIALLAQSFQSTIHKPVGAGLSKWL